MDFELLGVEMAAETGGMYSLLNKIQVFRIQTCFFIFTVIFPKERRLYYNIFGFQAYSELQRIDNYD